MTKQDDDSFPLYRSPVTGSTVWPDGTAYVVVTPAGAEVVWTPDWNDAKREADKWRDDADESPGPVIGSQQWAETHSDNLGDSLGDSPDF